MNRGEGGGTLRCCSPEYCAGVDHPAPGRGPARLSTNMCWISEWSKISEIPQSQKVRPQVAGPWASGFTLSLGFPICKVQEMRPADDCLTVSVETVFMCFTRHENHPRKCQEVQVQAAPALQVGGRAERPRGTPPPGRAVRSTSDSAPVVTLPAGSMYG